MWLAVFLVTGVWLLRLVPRLWSAGGDVTHPKPGT